MINKIILIAIAIGLLPAIGFAAEIKAKAKTWGWTLSVSSEGDEREKSCKLKLVAETYQIKREVSLKREHVNCALFGPTHLYAAEAPDHESVTVFFEAARGGDGDHSGPIVEAFRLTKKSLKKLGEQELFDATYHRKEEQITSVTGTVLYSLCESCDGPDASDPADNFYIPAKLTVVPTGISIKSNLSKQERKTLLEKFDARAAISIKENDHDKNFPKFIKDVRKEISTFVGK